MNVKKISWDSIDKLDDSIITYLLYREGKNIDVISKIRNISREMVEKHIIEAKIKIRVINSAKLKSNSSMLDKMLELTKAERLKFIKKMTFEEKTMLTNEIKVRYQEITNPDDKSVLIWLIGELRERSLVNLISKDIIHKNGNVRRMICSALGKIGDANALPILHKALHDKKPQVRQYAAKALRIIGNEESLSLLMKRINNNLERDYVKRAYEEAILSIQNRCN